MILPWIVTMLGSVAGAGIAYVTLTTAKGAPQEASGMAIALAAAILPYVFTRAVESISVANWRQELLAAVSKGAGDAHPTTRPGRIDPTLKS